MLPAITRHLILQIMIWCPGGSILRPLLFMIYVNNIRNAVTDKKSSACWCKALSIFKALKNSMVKLTECFSCNRLTLNITQLIMIYSMDLRNTKNVCKMTIDENNVIHCENKVKHLDVIGDEKLIWKHHILLPPYPNLMGVFSRKKHCVHKKVSDLQPICIFGNALWNLNLLVSEWNST